MGRVQKRIRTRWVFRRYEMKRRRDGRHEEEAAKDVKGRSEHLVGKGRKDAESWDKVRLEEKERDAAWEKVGTRG